MNNFTHANRTLKRNIVDLLGTTKPTAYYGSFSDYLDRLVTTKKNLYELNCHKAVQLCGIDLCVNVYEGIGELAAAAGQTLAIKPRNCNVYPLELYFVYQGVTFCQLKSAAAVAALGWEPDA